VTATFVSFSSLLSYFLQRVFLFGAGSPSSSGRGRANDIRTRGKSIPSGLVSEVAVICGIGLYPQGANEHLSTFKDGSELIKGGRKKGVLAV